MPTWPGWGSVLLSCPSTLLGLNPINEQRIERNSFSKEDGAGHCLCMSSLCIVSDESPVRWVSWSYSGHGELMQRVNWFCSFNPESLWPCKYAGKFSHDETFRSCFDRSWEGSSQPISKPFPRVPSRQAGLVSQLLAESRIYILTAWFWMPLENIPQTDA